MTTSNGQHRETLRWKDAPKVQFTYRTSSVSIQAGDGAELAAIRNALALTGTVNFTIAREAVRS